MHFVEKYILPNLHELKYKTLIGANFAFTVMELGGSFLTGETGPGTTKTNFLAFVESDYMPATYQPALLLYQNFRNGIAHSFFPKGASLPSKFHRRKHLQPTDEGLVINVPQLCEDVAAGLTALMRDVRQRDDLRQNHEAVIAEIDKEGQQNYQDYLQKHAISPVDVDAEGTLDTSLDH